MSAGDVLLGAIASIRGDDTKPTTRAKTVANGFGVMNTTNRDLIHADAKAGGYVVYNTTTAQLERWDSAAWVPIVTGGGGGMGFRITLSASTGDADPGAGTMRISTASYASAGSYTLYIDLLEYGGTDITAWLDSFDDTNGGVKGIIRLQSLADSTKWVEVLVTAWTTGSGYRKLSVTYLAGLGGLSTTAGDTFLSFDALGYTGTIATANIGDDQVTYSKIQNVSAASRVLLRGSASGAGDVEEGTCGVGVRINGTAIELSALLAALATAGTALQQPRMNAAATAAEWFTPDSLEIGADLTDSSPTINVSQGSVRVMRASTTTATRTITIGTSGSPEAGNVIQLLIYAQGNNVVITNGGPLSDVLYTVVAGTKRLVEVEWDTVNWFLSDLGRLN